MQVGRRIYMDYQATTPVDPRVVAAMLPFYTEQFGNAASRHHSFGWEAEAQVNAARAAIAAALGAGAREIVFTSGATESNNLAILGTARKYAPKGRHLLTCATEHRAVLDPMQALAAQGWELTVLGVDGHGRIDLDELRAALRPDTVLVSIMHGNNEIGTLQPVAEIGELCRSRGVLFHCDATQSIGKEAVDVERWQVDLLSASAHKFYGPKGAGFLYVRRQPRLAQLEPVLYGGGHERGLRSGTLNVPGIAGMAKALELCLEERAREPERLRALRDRLRDRLLAEIPGAELNGHPHQRLAGNLNLSFEWVSGSALLAELPDLALSTGSACTSASLEPSHVVRALGGSEQRAHGAVRFSLGRYSTEEQVDAAAAQVGAAVAELRRRSPLHRMGQPPARAAAPQ